MSDEDLPWKQFEKAVAEFMAAIGNGAQVVHDAILPDEHTGLPRQRDVWVEWSFGGHFPLKALVSCKRWKRPLDQKDIDHFNGEFLSSGAHIGIIYSKAGFNNHAVQKASILGFHCCRLYEDEPADLPDLLFFGSAYNFRPRFRISLTGPVAEYGFKTWKEVLDLPANSRTVLDALVEHFDVHQSVRDDLAQRWRRARLGSAFEVKGMRDGISPVLVRLDVCDRAFRAKANCFLVNGSYNITAGAFRGSQATPWIDTQSVHPGSGWEEVDSIPDVIPKPCIAMFMEAIAREEFLRFGQTRFS